VVESGPRFHFHKGLGSQARCLCHFESGDAHSSPEPAAGLYGGGRVGRAGRRTPCAGRAVMLTAVQSLRLACTEGGALGERVGVLRTQREL